MRFPSGRRLRFGRAGLVLASFLIVFAACADDQTPAADSPPPSQSDPTSAPPDPPVSAEDADLITLGVVTTSGDPSGNRVTSGRADLAGQPIEVTLATEPAWVVGAAVADAVVWVVAATTGEVTAFAERRGEVIPFPIGEVQLPSGAPPTLLAGGSTISVFQPRGVAPLAGHGLVDGTSILISPEGELFVGDREIDGFSALVDGRVVVSADGLVAVLVDPTEDLPHGVLGDAIEATAVAIVDPAAASVAAMLEAPPGTAFEAIAPMWADLDGDGREEILVTASDRAAGARLVAYSPDGDLIAASPPIGTGNRWLNQLAVAPLGPGGEIEIVEIRTPHIGGIVRWYRLGADGFELQATASPYSTHRIGSRNLDQGVVIDADGDAALEVVVPTQDQESIVSLGRIEGGAEVELEIALGARLATNLSAAPRPDGTTSLALGTEDRRLLVWP